MAEFHLQYKALIFLHSRISFEKAVKFSEIYNLQAKARVTQQTKTGFELYLGLCYRNPKGDGGRPTQHGHSS